MRKGPDPFPQDAAYAQAVSQTWHEIDWPSAADLDNDLARIADNLTDAIQRISKAADWLEARRDQIADDPAALQRLDVAVSEFRDGVPRLMAGSLALAPFVGKDKKLGIRTFGLDDPATA
jgi:hypothetical protein